MTILNQKVKSREWVKGDKEDQKRRRREERDLTPQVACTHIDISDTMCVKMCVSVCMQVCVCVCVCVHAHVCSKIYWSGTSCHASTNNDTKKNGKHFSTGKQPNNIHIPSFPPSSPTLTHWYLLPTQVQSLLPLDPHCHSPPPSFYLVSSAEDVGIILLEAPNTSQS